MSGPWVRVDDRLVHGQVLLGWAPRLKPRRIVLAHDKTAADAGLSEMYQALGEGEYDIEVVDVAAAAAELRDPARREGTFFVMGSVRDVRRVVELGAPLVAVNLGGLHATEASQRLTNSVFLSRQDVEDLCTLLDAGVALEARDVPSATSPAIDARMLAALWS